MSFRVSTREYKSYTYTDSRTGASVQKPISLDVYLPEGIDCWRNPLLRFSEPHKKQQSSIGFGGIVVERERVAQLVVWIHPGGFLQGNRKQIPPHLQRAVQNHRLVVVIPDFRLCPQVSIVESLTDIRDACEYALGGALGDSVNTSTWALGGNSAGGWAALLLGLGLTASTPTGSAVQLPTLSRLPRAVFAIYPVTDITREGGACFYEPLKPITWTPSVSAGVGGDGIIDGALLEPFLRKPGQAPLGGSTERPDAAGVNQDEEGEEEEEDASAVVTSSDPENDPIRSQLFNYARQEGIFPSLVLPSDLPPERVSIPALLRGEALTSATASAAAAAAAASSSSSSSGPPNSLPLSTSQSSLSSRSPLLNLPPTFIAWADADDRVPPSQSIETVKALRACVGGAEVQTHVVKGKEHLFDYEEDAEIPGLWRWLMQKMGGLT
ncbi:unnamed protein product [Tilletia laevis]|uniref:Alpha/beta hydrolase fold-3 domain-containing protein n=2 Tax=Tilletia TaxID=13289 RepID=A0A177V6P9_9BASI|nr:hypothetical protein CF336_g2643 [Tilletia laevis]KAE8262899.1 hypothetical protein A4X03_0g2092 [Tilletia caries]KAE8206506.1 hypothetical protein CF335_g1836 [Tilletia laevis]CAD6886437.1 unnamed protein product [Tilletia caries]CAD6911079.1 unnamed protein product [Tilletia laevis]